MVSFHLEDINEIPLRAAAIELGISGCGSMTKAELTAAIKAKISPDAPLNLAPMSPKETRPWRTPSVIVSSIALFVAMLSALASWWGTIHTVGKITHEIEAAEREAWQSVKVYDIIVQGTTTAEKWMGLSFEEIKSRYTEEVVAERNVKLGKEELQTDELKRVLKSLMTNNLVIRTVEGKYAVYRHVMPSWDCVRRPTTEASERAVMKILTTDSGKYTVEKLVTKIRTDSAIPSEDLYAAINCMRARNLVVVDGSGLVWSGLEAPKQVEVPNTMPGPKSDPMGKR